MKRSLALGALSAALTSVLATSASAVVLLPNDTALPAVPDVAPLGTLLTTQTTNVVASGGAFTGIFTVRVYEATEGTLNFLYQFANDASSEGAISRISVTGFTNPMFVDASYRTDFGGAQTPTSVDRSGGIGDVIGFNFMPAPFGQGKIDAGEMNFALLLRTNATEYDMNHAANVANGGAANFLVLGPSPVPEPASLAALGLGALGLLRRRRQR